MRLSHFELIIGGIDMIVIGITLDLSYIVMFVFYHTIPKSSWY